MNQPASYLLFCLSVHLLTASPAAANTAPIHFLRNQAQVDSQGIFLDQIVADTAATPLPHLRLADAPAVGRMIVLTRAQVLALLQSHAPELAGQSWTGADQVRITRRMRVLHEEELRQLLTASLQQERVRDCGELELIFTRRWASVTVPDEALELRVLDMPATGVSSHFIVRMELRTAQEALGCWQISAQARVWSEVLVAATPLYRGRPLGPNDLLRARRDLLSLRDPLTSLPDVESALEYTENVQSGAPLTRRSLRARPVVHRGDLVDALLQDGALSISLKVEVLEEGACGQAVRVRNPVSKREFRGKVQNEQTILVML